MNIWIFNHYATNMFYDGAGRHHSIAKYLIKNGHDVSIFCANTIHGSNRSIQIESDGFLGKTGVDGVRYIFIKTIPYKDNGFDRVKNMYSFYKNLFKVSKACLNLYNKPDVILASSVHPLTLVAGIKIAKKVNVPCICEIRDLWPETLIDLNILKAESFVSKILYRGEKWIYKKANQIIFTMPGGADYIKDKNWDNDISLDKIHYINNGVDLEKYNEDLKYKVTYTTNKENTKTIATNLSTTKDNTIDFTKEKLDEDEYITKFALVFDSVKSNFKSTKDITVAAKVIEGLEVNSTFKNCVVVGGTYIGVTVEDKDCTPTTVYENKVEINKTAAEDNQYTGDKAGDKLSNITFDIFNAETDEKFGTINIQNGYGELKYLPIGKWYAVETSKNDYYIFPENNRFDFEITQKGQTVVLDIENDVVNLIVDVEKTGTVETEPGKDITYNFDIQNKSNDTVTNFIWGDILPSEVRAKSITTGTFNKDNTYKVQYITNNNSNWKTIKTCNTNESSEILLDSNTLELAENEYVTEVRFVFENPVEKGFKNEGTKIIVTANDDLQNNQIIENHTYITADYLDVKLDDEDEFHTIIRIPEPEKPKTLPRTGK